MTSTAAVLLLAALPASARHATAELLCDRTAVSPGGHATLMIRFTIEPGWHLYWQNPGDTGLPPKIKWTLPPGVTAGDPQFPVPERIKLGDLTAFGYRDGMSLLVPLSVSKNATGTLALKADVRWVVCNEDCVSEKQTLTLSLPLGTGNPANEQGFAQARAGQPVRREGSLMARVNAAGTAGDFVFLGFEQVSGQSLDTTSINFVDFFPPPTDSFKFDNPVPHGDGSPTYYLPFKVLPGAPKSYSGAGILVTRRGNGKPVAEQMRFTIELP